MTTDVRPLTVSEYEAFQGESSVNVAISSAGVEYYGDDDGLGEAQFVADEDGDYIPVES